jgi:ATP-binding cassette subfamily B protein
VTDTDPVASARLRLRRHLEPFRRQFTILGVASSTTAVIESAVIVTLVPLAEAVAVGDERFDFDLFGTEHSVSVTTLAALVVVLTLARGVGQLAVASRTGAIVAAYQTHNREALLGAYLDADWSVQATEAAGRLQDTATLQVERGTHALAQACLTLSAIASLCIMVTAALVVNPIAAAAILVAGGLLFALTRPLSTLAERSSRQLVRNDQEFAGQIEQAVGLARELRVFDGTARFRERVEDLVRRSRLLKASQVRLLLTLPAIYQNLAITLIAVGLGIIAWRDVGQVTELATIVLLLVRALAYSQIVQVQYHQLTESLPYLDTVADKIAAYQAARAEPDRGEPVGPVRQIAFDDVAFHYDERSTGLVAVSFQATPGDVVAVIGPSGAGKSTMVQLLLGLRVPTDGRVVVNDDDLRSRSARSWHRRIGFVPQEPHVIEGTVADNIRFFRDDLDDTAVERAATMANLDQAIAGWPGGYQAQVRDFGGRMSGGERQRLCIARALATNPDVLVFDEPTSSLDPSSASAVHDSMLELRHDHIVVLVAHDQRSLALCTHVLVLIDGHVDYFGPVDEARRESAYLRSTAQWPPDDNT